MADVFSKEKRSWIMSRIRSKNTKLEINFRRLLWNEGFRYRIHYKEIPGKPDIAFPSRKVAIFVDSHFWHGYEWNKLQKRLKSKYWKKKIRNNIDRDKKVNRQLQEMGWKVIRLWENEIEDHPKKCINRIKRYL